MLIKVGAFIFLSVLAQAFLNVTGGDVCDSQKTGSQPLQSTIAVVKYV